MAGDELGWLRGHGTVPGVAALFGIHDLGGRLFASVDTLSLVLDIFDD